MAANLLPTTSDGGFTTTGNIIVGDDTAKITISSDALQYWGASPAPNISGFSSATFAGDVTSSNISLISGYIKGGVDDIVDDGINDIYTGATTTMDVFGFPFSQLTRGVLNISGDIDPTQALGTWYYQSINTTTFEIFTDSTYSTPVNSTSWTSYSGGANVAITKLAPPANVVIDSAGFLTKFDNTGNVAFPNSVSIAGGEIYLTGEGLIRSNNDTVTIQSYDTANSIGRGLRVGDNGGLYLEQGSDQPWLNIVPNAGNAEIYASTATGGAAGHSISIAAGSADQTGYYDTAGGNVNIVGGLGAGNDGGGGGPGGSVNISSGNSADPAGHYGNVLIQTGGSNNWTFDYTGNLTIPGTLTSNNGLEFGSPLGINLLANGITGLEINSSNVDVYTNNSRRWVFESNGNLTAVSGTINANITGNTNGYTIGYRDVPQVAASNTTIALTDAGKHYYSTTAGNFTLTIPNNTTTSFSTGTAISIVVQAAGNILVNAASGVTLYMAGNSTAANRVVGTYGMATIMKVATDTWFINGTGVS